MRHLGWTVIGVGAACAQICEAQSPDVLFVPCDDCGIGTYEMAPGLGGGVAAADVNDDGFVDLFVPTASGVPHQFYLNNGDGTFTDIAADAGLDLLSQGRTSLWFDSDGDGDLDLLIANDDPEEPSTYHLFRQTESLVFVDDTAAAGLFMPLPDALHPGDPPHRGGMAAGDFNNDGMLDLVTTVWNGQPEVYFNDGAGAFIDVTATAGVVSSVDYPWQPILFDVNRDGWLDIYLAVDFRWNGLFISQGDGTFVDIAPAAHADSAWNDMGVALGDYDRDGDHDLYITNITSFGTHNVLLRNDSSGAVVDFVETAQQHAVDDGGWGWGCAFFDADNDGWLDIAATNGWDSIFFEEDESRFFWNRLGTGEDAFADRSADVGFNDVDWGSCLLSVDVNRDGRVDLIQTCVDGPLRVLVNSSLPARGSGGETEPSWIVVRPRMSGPNRFAIGAEVTIEVAGESPQTRVITAGSSFLGQEPAEAHFGLAEAESVERVWIDWPNGTCTVVSNVETNQVLTILDDDGEPCPVLFGDIDHNGVVGLGDLLMVIGQWGACSSCDACTADIAGPVGEPDCMVGLHDLLAVLMNWGQS